MSDSKRTVQITLPSFDWRNLRSHLFSWRSFFALLVCLCSAWSVYWWKAIRPYEPLQGAALQVQLLEMFAESNGRLSEFFLNEGDLFSKGQTLFSFADPSLSSQLRLMEEKGQALRLEIRQEKNKLDQNMQQYLYLQNEFELETGPAELTHQILDQIQLQQKKITSVERELSNLESDETAIRRKIESLAVLAPFEGMVLQRFKQIGEKISAGDSVLTVCDKNKRWVEASASESLLGKIQLGTLAKIHFDSFPGKAWVGKVTWISPIAAGGKIKIRMTAENLPLNPGLSAKVAIKIHS